jgi:hypothetical protein
MPDAAPAETIREIFQLTDALLAAVRLPNPDLDAVQLLLQRRGELLARLPEPGATDRRQRVLLLQQLQAADAELRGRLELRRAAVRAELQALAGRQTRPRRQPVRPSLLDHRV